MIPSTAIQPRSRTGARKRTLQEIRISPEPVPSEDVLLRADSDDDSDGTRAWKKARREAFALQYLEHDWVPIMTAKLKGPFDEGWKNPWARRKPKAVAQNLGHQDEQSLSPSVRQTSNKIVRSRIDARKISPVPYSEARSKTNLPYSTLPELSSSTTRRQHTSLQRGDPTRKQSPNAPPSPTSRLDSPSRQLNQQLQDAVSQESAGGFHSSDSELESNEEARGGLPRLSVPQRLPRKSLQYSRRRLSEIDRPVVQDVVSLLQNQPEQVHISDSNLEDDLNLLWERTSLFDRDGSHCIMRLEHIQGKLDNPEKAKLRKRPIERPVITYTGKPVIPDPDGEGIARFSVRQFKDIQNKLLAGFTMVQQRLDTVKASRNPSVTITCCDMLIQLAQAQERVDHVLHLYRVYKDLPKRSSLAREAWNTFNLYQGRLSVDSSSGSSDSFHDAESGSSLIKRTKDVEKSSGTNLAHIYDEAQLLVEQNEAEQAIDEHNRSLNDFNNGVDIDMDDASDLESIDIPLDDRKEEQEILVHKSKDPVYNEVGMRRGAHKVVADDIRHSLRIDEFPPEDTGLERRPLKELVHVRDRNDILGAVANAESKEHDDLEGTPFGRDPDGQRLPGATFVAEIDKSVVKTLSNEVSGTTDMCSSHGGSTQMNIPDDSHLPALQFRDIQISKLSDGQEQKQSPAGEPQIAVLHKQARRQSPVEPDSDHAIEPKLEVKSNSTSISRRPISPVLHNARTLNKSNPINGDRSTSIPPATNPIAPKASAMQDITIIELDSGPDTSKDDAQHQSPLKLIKSGNNETLHSIADADASAATPTTESISDAKLSDMAQEGQPVLVANTQRRFERFTHFLQDVHLRVQKKSGQQQSQNDPQNNSSVKPLSPAKIGPDHPTSGQNRLSRSPNLPRPNDKNFNPLAHSIAQQEHLERPFHGPEVTIPNLNRTSTTEKEQNSPQSSVRIMALLPSRNTSKNQTNLYTPIAQQHMISYESKPWFPASQPGMPVKSSKDIQPFGSSAYSRTISSGIESPIRHHALGIDAASTGAKAYGELQGTVQASNQDAQRIRPHITDSEERDALDVATDLLGNWNAEKEPSQDGEPVHDE